MILYRSLLPSNFGPGGSKLAACVAIAEVSLGARCVRKVVKDRLSRLHALLYLDL